MPFVVLSVLLHAVVGWRLVPALPHPWGIVLAGGLAVSATLLPLAFGARRIHRQPLADRVAATGLWCLGLFSSLLVLTVLRDVALLAAVGVDAAAPGTVDLHAAARATAIGVPLLALAVTLVGLVNARRTASVVHVDVPIDGLPRALHGFTIAQISDVHVGPTIKRPYLDAIVRAVNRLEADLIAVTGDLVDGPVHRLAPHVAPLATLCARHGTFFVTGNHEYYSGVSAWVEELRRLGLRVLLNEHVVVEREGEAIVVAGVTDHGGHHYDESHRSDPRAALDGAPAHAAVKVLLAHQPRTAPAAAAAGFDLQISGHTHGGQFWPWNWLVPLQQPFTAGLHRWEALWVYVSRGTGYWGPPKRFGAPSEITRLRLVPAT
ncbi:MAG TPA: metallophosphoesterase [Caldimonas sp.]|nr:metallophosphoesterase [Caldimonas sp.]